jgi:hypothetical protein
VGNGAEEHQVVFSFSWRVRDKGVQGMSLLANPRGWVYGDGRVIHTRLLPPSLKLIQDAR